MYNAENLIHVPIESIIDQTYKEWEIIIIDDGSTDNSFFEAQKLLIRFRDKIKIIRTSNNGLSKARDLGMTMVTADWVIFLDSDDYLELDFFEKFNLELINMSSNVISDVYIFDFNTVFDNKTCIEKFASLSKTYRGNELLTKILEKNGPVLWTSNLIYSSKLIVNYNIKFYIIDRLQNSNIGLTHMQGEEIMFAKWAIYNSFNVSYIPIVSANYVQHNSNMSKTFSSSRIGTFYNSYYLLTEFDFLSISSKTSNVLRNLYIQQILNGFLYNLFVLKNQYQSKHLVKINYVQLLKMIMEFYPQILKDYQILAKENFKYSINSLISILFLYFPRFIMLLLDVYFSNKFIVDSESI